MKIKLVALATTIPVLLAGCGLFGEDGTFRNRSKDYLLAEELPPMVVPEGMDSGVGQLYPIPPIAETAILDDGGEFPRPMPLSENNLEEVVKIQSLADERWILINRAPSEVWPRVRNILNRSGIPTVKAEATDGILETGWLEFRGDNQYNHRYRFYIQPGVQLNSTEIKILQDQSLKSDEPQNTPWPARSTDDKRESDMVEIMANAMAGDDSGSSVSLLAQSIGGEQKVEIVTPKVADPYLLMRLDYERAWASIAYSLQRGGFTTVDQDQSGGVFFTNYTPEEYEEPGFFSRLFSWGEDEVVLETNYLVLISRVDGGVQIRVVDKERGGLERSQAIRLLTIIRSNLS